MRLFRKRIKFKGCAVLKHSCEDEHVVYVEFPDGLRLRFRDGEYDGWYVAGGAE